MDHLSSMELINQSLLRAITYCLLTAFFFLTGPVEGHSKDNDPAHSSYASGVLQQDIKLSIVIVDAETKQKITAKVRVLDITNRKVLFGNSVSDTVKLNLKSGGEYRVISKSDETHLFNEQELDFRTGTFDPKMTVVLELSPIKIGTKLQLKEVYFENNSAKVKEESMPELQEVFELLREHPQVVIQIAAHTDNTGTHDDNMELSGRRAQSVVEILKDKGVPEAMLVAKGYGETEPLVPNTSEANKQKNRRVEFIIVDINK